MKETEIDRESVGNLTGKKDLEDQGLYVRTILR